MQNSTSLQYASSTDVSDIAKLSSGRIALIDRNHVEPRVAVVNFHGT